MSHIHLLADMNHHSGIMVYCAFPDFEGETPRAELFFFKRVLPMRMPGDIVIVKITKYRRRFEEHHLHTGLGGDDTQGVPTANLAGDLGTLGNGGLTFQVSANLAAKVAPGSGRNSGENFDKNRRLGIRTENLCRSQQYRQQGKLQDVRHFDHMKTVARQTVTGHKQRCSVMAQAEENQRNVAAKIQTHQIVMSVVVQIGNSKAPGVLAAWHFDRLAPVLGTK